MCASSERYARVLHDQDERHSKKQGENAPPLAPQPGDGRHVGLRLMSPDEVQQMKSGSQKRTRGGERRGD